MDQSKRKLKGQQMKHPFNRNEWRQLRKYRYKVLFEQAQFRASGKPTTLYKNKFYVALASKVGSRLEGFMAQGGLLPIELPGGTLCYPPMFCPVCGSTSLRPFEPLNFRRDSMIAECLACSTHFEVSGYLDIGKGGPNGSK
jgi:hypothetical protein